MFTQIKKEDPAMTVEAAKAIDNLVLDQDVFVYQNVSQFLLRLSHMDVIVMESALPSGRTFLARNEYDFLFLSSKCDAHSVVYEFQPAFLKRALDRILDHGTNLLRARKMLLAGGVKHVAVNLKEMKCRLISNDCKRFLNYDIISREWNVE